MRYCHQMMFFCKQELHHRGSGLVLASPERSYSGLLGGNGMTEDCFRMKTVFITKGFSRAPPTLPHGRIQRENSCSWVKKQTSTTTTTKNLASPLILVFSAHIHRQEAIPWGWHPKDYWQNEFHNSLTKQKLASPLILYSQPLDI